MADIFIINSGDSTNCPHASLIIGPCQPITWTPSESGCLTFTAPDWDIRWDDVC